MRREQDGRAFRLQLLDERPELAASFRIEPCRRLVKEEHLGSTDDAEGDIEPTTLTARELAVARVGLLLQTDRRDDLLRIARVREVPGEVPDRLAHGEFTEIAIGLQHDAQPRTPGQAAGLWVGAEYLHGAGIRMPIALQDLRRGGLARPIRAKQRQAFTGLDIEGHPIDRSDIPIRFVQITHFDRIHFRLLTESNTIHSLYAYSAGMRLAELSRTTGVPPATIKWYLREGLLPKGEPTARNHAQYDDVHVRRLRLIRALVDIGGLTTQEARAILTVVDDPDASIDEVVGAAHGALARVPDTDIDPAALTQVDRFLASRGWTVTPDSPARAELAGIVRAMAQLSPGPDPSDAALVAGLAPYADAIDQLAAAEVAELPHDVPRDVLVEQVVLGTVLAERLIGSLRRLAQESAFLSRYVAPSDTDS